MREAPLEVGECRSGAVAVKFLGVRIPGAVVRVVDGNEDEEENDAVGVRLLDSISWKY